MSDAKVRGKVHLIEETKSYGQRGFRKRMVVLEQDNGRFVNYIPVEFTHEGCDSVDELKEGDEIEVRYRLSGRRWQRDANSEVKFFLSAQALDFEIPGGGGGGGNADDINAGLAEAAYDEDEDIPF